VHAASERALLSADAGTMAEVHNPPASSSGPWSSQTDTRAARCTTGAAAAAQAGCHRHPRRRRRHFHCQKQRCAAPTRAARARRRCARPGCVAQTARPQLALARPRRGRKRRRTSTPGAHGVEQSSTARGERGQCQARGPADRHPALPFTPRPPARALTLPAAS